MSAGKEAPPSNAHTNAEAAWDLALLRDGASLDVRTLTLRRCKAQVRAESATERLCVCFI